MSININITLPLDVVAEIQALPDEPSDDEANAAMTPAMAQAMMTAIRTLPFSVAAKSIAGGQKRKPVEDPVSVVIMDDYGNMMRISVDSAVTVNALKNSISHRCGVPQDEQRLFLKSKVLHGDMTLTEVQVLNDTLCETF